MRLKKDIEDLRDFNKEETFAKLLDRAYKLDELIASTQKLRALDITFWNVLAMQGINVNELIIEKSELFSIYYRSMFQAAAWEDTHSGHITPAAYHFNASHMTPHEKVREHVNTTLAHQDMNDGERRFVYNNISDGQGNFYKIVSNNIKYHLHELEQNVSTIKSSITTAFFEKFNYKLQLLNRK